MVNGQAEERNFELRSEKVRSIVGQIPSSLMRYGIMAMGDVLLALFLVAYQLPFRRVYSGTASVRDIPLTGSDSFEACVLLRFEGAAACRSRWADSGSLWFSG